MIPFLENRRDGRDGSVTITEIQNDRACVVEEDHAFRILQDTLLPHRIVIDPRKPPNYWNRGRCECHQCLARSVLTFYLLPFHFPLQVAGLFSNLLGLKVRVMDGVDHHPQHLELEG